MSLAELKDRGVLITRAAAQSAALCEAVEAQGGRAYAFPTLEIQLTPAAQIQTMLGRIQAGDTLIFVSMNAVRGALKHATPLLRKRISACRIAAVGARSCQALQAQGLDVEIQAAADQQNSEGLLRHPGLQKHSLLQKQTLQGLQKQTLQESKKRRVWILRGQSGRELLGDTLRQRGAEVRYIQAYRRSVPTEYDAKPVLAALQSKQIQLVLLTSYAVFSNLLLMLGEHAVSLLQTTQLIVPGQRVADNIQSEYDFNIGIADNASDQAMLACAAKNWGQTTV